MSLSPLHRWVRHPWYFLGLLILWTQEMNAALLVTALATPALDAGVLPEDRADAVSRPLTKSGGRLIGSCLTFGEYDFLTSVEALSFRSAGGT